VFFWLAQIAGGSSGRFWYTFLGKGDGSTQWAPVHHLVATFYIVHSGTFRIRPIIQEYHGRLTSSKVCFLSPYSVNCPPVGRLDRAGAGPRGGAGPGHSPGEWFRAHGSHNCRRPAILRCRRWRQRRRAVEK